MYELRVSGTPTIFKSKSSLNMMKAIRKAARNSDRIFIRYLKASTNRVVTKTIAPYSFKDGILYATDKRSGATQIRSFIFDNIKSVSPSPLKFKPEWKVFL